MYQNNLNNQFDVLDLLSIMSFAIQMENQKNIVSIKDIQHEVDAAVDNIHQHLENQDKKINYLISLLEQERPRHQEG